MLVKSTPRYTLYAKTRGGISNQSNKARDWYVGFVETDDDVFYFALNIEDSSVKDIKDLRIKLTESHLRHAGVI
jgi:beta-lactamase class D